MAKALPSYMYGDPSLAVDRIRADEARKKKRKAERDAQPPKTREAKRK